MEITLELKATLIHASAGILVGALSGILTKDPYQVGNTLILLIAIALLVAAIYLTKFIFKLDSVKDEKGKNKYGIKWLLSNSAYPYLIFWLLAWIVIYNI